MRSTARWRTPDEPFAAETMLAVVGARLREHLGDRPERADRRPPDVIASDLRDLLDERPFEPLTLREAERILHVSSTHLVRCFSRAFGIPPHRYLLGRRIDAARRRLLAGEPVAQVAVNVGFHDQAHLTRHFKRHVGTTPARFARSTASALAGGCGADHDRGVQRIGTFDPGSRPIRATASAVRGACCALVSISRWPRGASHGGAPSITRRWTSRPSGPPSSATRGSWTRASAGSSAIASVGTYGAFATRTSTRPWSDAGSAS